MKYCNSCGSQMQDESVFCSNCGARYEEDEATVYMGAGANTQYQAPQMPQAPVTPQQAPQAPQQSMNYTNYVAATGGNAYTPKPQKSSKKSIIVLLVCIAVFFLLIIIPVMFAIFSNDNDYDDYNSNNDYNIIEEDDLSIATNPFGTVDATNLTYTNEAFNFKMVLPAGFVTKTLEETKEYYNNALIEDAETGLLYRESGGSKFYYSNCFEYDSEERDDIIYMRFIKPTDTQYLNFSAYDFAKNYYDIHKETPVDDDGDVWTATSIDVEPATLASCPFNYCSFEVSSPTFSFNEVVFYAKSSGYILEITVQTTETFNLAEFSSYFTSLEG